MMKLEIVMRRIFAAALVLALGIIAIGFRSNAEFNTQTPDAKAAAEKEAAIERGEVEDVSGIDLYEAYHIALKHAGYSEEVIRWPKFWDAYEEDGTPIVKVIFYLGPVEFGYHIDKITGDVLSREVND